MQFKTIPYSRQNISRQDIKAVIKTLKSDFLTQGPVVPEFENAVAAYCGAKYGVATNSATSALHIALLALDVRPGDRVWTSPNSFVASANSALYCGAKIDFVDIEQQTYNMDTSCLQRKLERAEKLGILPKVVIPVHFAGQSCDMEKIYELSKKYGFRIIEDASHAIGGRYQNEVVGKCQFSDVTVFSFHPVKIITTGEGGMAITNNQGLDQIMRMLRSHGTTVEKASMVTRPSKEIWNYQQIELGFNYRMTDIQAALGLSQLKNLDNFVFRRNKIAQKYNKDLEGLPLTVPHVREDILSSYHLYPIRIKNQESKKSRFEIYRMLKGEGIEVNIHYIPIHLQPFYSKLGFKRGMFPQSEMYFSDTISLPIFPSMTKRQLNYVINTLQNIIAS